MADRRDDEVGETKEGEREGEGLPAEDQGTTAQHPLTMRSPSSSRSAGQAPLPHQRSALNLGSMSTALPDGRYTSYQGMPVYRQAQLMAGQAPPLQNQQYVRMPLYSLQAGQGGAPTQQFVQPFPHGRPILGYHTSYTGGSVSYGNHEGSAQPFPQSLPQPQQPILFNQFPTGYYPIQQHLAQQTYDNAAGPAFTQQQNYFPPAHALGQPGNHSATTAGFAGPAVLPAHPAGVSRPSSASSATSSTLRGPPRKPKQSGFALWCGNLPAQTNIVDLKDHFSRDATYEIESVFLISKSNCAFINYKSEESCTVALARFHDSRFQGAKLVCRLRRNSTAPPAGTPTGPRSIPGSKLPSQFPGSSDDRSVRGTGAEAGGSVPAPMRKTGEKFFILKSLTVEDLDASVRSGSWATQSQNEEALNAAYKSAENVYLVFSANKSGEYYGYARMISGIDDTSRVGESPLPRMVPSPSVPADSSVTIPTPATAHAPRGYIVDDSARGTIFWEAETLENHDGKDMEDEATSTTETADSEMEQQSLGHPFKIKWLSTQKLPFHRARALRNPWNQNREVKIARDGTEIEPSVGRRLVNLFHATQVMPPSAGSQPPYPVANPHLQRTTYLLDPRFGRPY